MAAHTKSTDLVMFAGTDTADNIGLWVTDGTAAGTHELTGISGTYPGPGGFHPADFTVFKNEVLFNGYDITGRDTGLWVTDGTATGTHELTGIKGANPAGLDPTDFTVFNNEVFFRGVDANGQIGLWETNGTPSGTHEITGISSAYTGSGGLNPQDLTDPPSVTLTGGHGADTFVFPPNFGDETITNFDVQQDTIQLPHSEFANVAVVLADIHQVGANVEIAPDAHDVITLNNVTAALLHASNFHLV
jgi:ELWxxDGT repeat protein